MRHPLAILISAFVLAVTALPLSVAAFTMPAFTVHYSSAHAVIAPQVSASVSSSTDVNDFLFFATPSDVILQGPSSGTTSIGDVIYNYVNSGSTLHTCQLGISGNASPPTYSSIIPSVATVDQSGNISYVSDGIALFNAKVGQLTKGVFCTISEMSGYSQALTGYFAPSSLAEDMLTQVSNLISGLSPGGSTQGIYSSVDDTNHIYTRNTGMFAAGLDLTSIPAYVEYSGGGTTQEMGVLVAPDIMLQANHAHPGVGDTVYFVTASNATVSRTIASQAQVYSDGNPTDIEVSRLSSPILSGITPMKVFASTTIASSTYQGSISETAASLDEIPVLATNQARSITIAMIYQFAVRPQVLYIYPSASTTSPFYDWYRTPVGGDSGSGVFGVVDGQPVFLGGWYSSADIDDEDRFISDIDSTIGSLGSSYSLTPFDASGFPTYQ